MLSDHRISEQRIAKFVDAVPKGWKLLDAGQIANDQWICALYQESRRMYGLMTFIEDATRAKPGPLIKIQPKYDNEVMVDFFYRFCSGDYPCEPGHTQVSDRQQDREMAKTVGRNLRSGSATVTSSSTIQLHKPTSDANLRKLIESLPASTLTNVLASMLIVLRRERSLKSAPTDAIANALPEFVYRFQSHIATFLSTDWERRQLFLQVDDVIKKSAAIHDANKDLQTARRIVRKAPKRVLPTPNSSPWDALPMKRNLEK